MENATLRELAHAVRAQEGSGAARFASVYMETSHDTADAAKVLQLTWREARDDLAGQGAGAPTLNALESAVEGLRPTVGRGGHGLIAAGDAVLASADLATPPTRPVHRWSNLPYLVPLIAHGRPDMAHVVVCADQVGAEITATGRDGRVAEEREVTGHEQVHEPKPYGQPPRGHVREHVRERVRQNVVEIADAVTELAGKVSAELIVLAGETQGRAALREHLPDQLRPLVAEVPAAEHAADVRDIVDVLVAQRQNERTDTLLDWFRGQLAGSGDLAVHGIDATCAALREANVETLVLGELDERTLVISGTDPIELASGEEELRDIGITPRGPQRADEAIPIAAVAVGADLVYAGERLDLDDGVGARLRHK